MSSELFHITFFSLTAGSPFLLLPRNLLRSGDEKKLSMVTNLVLYGL